MYKRIAVIALSCLVFAPGMASAQTKITCENVAGKLNEFILPQSQAPFDPFGRILGTVRGSFQGATTAALSSLAPINSNGDLKITVTDVFSTEEGENIVTKGAATWTSIKPGFYQVDLTLVIAGGTGKYAQAVGTIYVLGVGQNVGPGTGQFVQQYKGQVCYPTP